MKKSSKWVNPVLYPFDHKYIELKNGHMHYVDEGSGEVILFVHGTPTWSFLYRHFIKKLSTEYRCIAIDHLGFGLSEMKEESQKSTPQFHSENLREFIERMALSNITLVVHDFGGPIGLSAAIEDPTKFKNIILFNTWLWESKCNPAALKVDKMVNSWLGKWLYLYANISARLLLKQGFHKKKNLSREVHQHYIQPFPNKRSRKVLLDLAQSLVGSSDWYEDQWKAMERIQEKNWLILWGMKDSFIGPDYLQKWVDRMPSATIAQFECGHFVQEEEPVASTKFMHKFLKETLHHQQI